MQMSSFAKGLLAACIGIGLATSAQAAEKLKFAHANEATHPLNQGALWAAEQIKERTQGRYEIEVYPASSLGKQVDIIEGLGLGSVDIVYAGTPFIGNDYPPISIAAAPYIFRDFDHFEKFRKSDLFKELAKGYEEQSGHLIMAMPYYGYRQATSNKPLNTPADMKGLKIRVPNAPLYMMFPKAVGANPTPLAFAEVYLALQQGVVDAQENPLPTIEAKRFYEVQKYINLTNHLLDTVLTIMSGDTYARLSDEDKKIFHDVLTESASYIDKMTREAEATLADKLNAIDGVTVNKVDVTAFRNATVKLHNTDDTPWSREIYDRLQAIK